MMAWGGGLQSSAGPDSRAQKKVLDLDFPTFPRVPARLCNEGRLVVSVSAIACKRNVPVPSLFLL